MIGTSAARADDTVILDIHDLGAERVAALKAQPSVLWAAEFGNEMLMAVSAESRAHWLSRKDARPGPEFAGRDDVRVRDHVCTIHDAPPALAVVGGYEILRIEPAWREQGLPLHGLGQRVPEDGVVSREVRNDTRPRGAVALDPTIQAVVDRVDGNRWFQTVSDLSAFNRNSYSPGLTNARTWILDQFTAHGLSTETFPFTLTSASCVEPLPNITLANPIGRKVGSALPDEWIVLGAHYDSRNSQRCDGSVNPQPGANDNASGCAGVIELARAFEGLSTRRSILFMCFAGEEQGLVGSRRYVDSLVDSGEITKVKHMINIDMIGHAVNDNLDTRIETNTQQQAWLAQYADVAATYAPELNLIQSSATQGYSDHWFFLQQAIPTMFTWENGAGIYPHYHQATDTPANLVRGPALASGILKMDAAMIAILAEVQTMFGDGFEQ